MNNTETERQEFDTQWTDDPTCPYCGESNEDWYDMDLDTRTQDMECDSCGKVSKMEVSVEYSFTTWKK